MNNVKYTTHHHVKYRYDHTTITRRKVGFNAKKVYNQLYHMRQFLHIMMTDIKNNL